jgi:hypothetical protein
MISTGTIGRSWAANYTTTSRLPLHPSIGPPNTPYPPQSMQLHYQQGGVPDNAYYYNTDEPLSHAALSFVHGGLSPTYKDLTPFPSRINEISDSLLRKLQRREQPPPHPPNAYPGLPASKHVPFPLSFCLYLTASQLPPRKRRSCTMRTVRCGIVGGPWRARKRFALMLSKSSRKLGQGG